MPIYRFADFNVKITPRFKYSGELLAPYKISESGEFDFSATASEKDIRAEFENDKAFPPAYHESLCILRNLSRALSNTGNGFLFHASTVAYKGKAYAFTAASGTGKSTHTALLKNLLGDELVYVNDDKPFVRYFQSEKTFYAYGNCWNGKHSLGENVKFPLAAIVFLTRGEKNSVTKITEPLECLPEILSQTLYPEDEKQAKNLFNLLQTAFETIPFYKLKCNMESDAPVTSFENILCDKTSAGGGAI